MRNLVSHIVAVIASLTTVLAIVVSASSSSSGHSSAESDTFPATPSSNLDQSSGCQPQCTDIYNAAHPCDMDGNRHCGHHWKTGSPEDYCCACGGGSWSTCPSSPAPQGTQARRVTVNGSRLMTPEGKELRPVGFNFNAISVTPEANDGQLMQQTVKGANLARIVGIKWLNDHPLQAGEGCQQQCSSNNQACQKFCSEGYTKPQVDGSAHECYTPTAPYFAESCFAVMDSFVQKAVNGTNNWVTITVRGMYAAGQAWDQDPGGTVFGNATLREQFFQAWELIAAHYKGQDNILAYELLAEPRLKAEDTNASLVQQFYQEGCERVAKVDPLTPCMVGPRSYYNVFLFDASILLQGLHNVIYTFDYFMPQYYWAGPSGRRRVLPKYPASYSCDDLYKGWVQSCPGGYHHRNDPMSFDKDWHRALLQRAVTFRQSNNVPIFLNQWGAAHGISTENGRYQYMSDIASLAQEMDFGWAWWTFRGNSGGWVDGSTKIVSGDQVDQAAVDALKDYMG